jgi:cyclophilin family peptidyl-prolyl cis-trans isomerase
METTMGSIVVELNPAKAPITVKNFLQYVKAGFYDNTVIHRVVKGFVVQGGGYESSLSSYPTWTTKAVQKAIVLEPTSVTGLSNTQGTIAMARGSELNTATSQFFFNTVNNNPNTGAYNGTNLDLPTGKGYAVFGSIVQGMSFVQAIENVAVGTVGSYGNVPTTMITVTAATQTQ